MQQRRTRDEQGEGQAQQQEEERQFGAIVDVSPAGRQRLSSAVEQRYGGELFVGCSQHDTTGRQRSSGSSVSITHPPHPPPP